MRAVTGWFVRLWGSGGLAGQGRCGTAGIDALLFLPAVAEPDPNHLLLHVELLCNQQDLFRGRLLVLGDTGIQSISAVLNLGHETTHYKSNKRCMHIRLRFKSFAMVTVLILSSRLKPLINKPFSLSGSCMKQDLSQEKG